MNDIRIFEDIEKPKSTIILDDAKHELEEIKKASEPTIIDNIQFIYSTQPNGLFSVIRIPALQYYIVKTAHIKLAFDALFYPENVDKMYPCTLITAAIMGSIKDFPLLLTSIIELINNTIKSNLTNIDPNTKGPHPPEELIKNFDKAHPYKFNKLIPYISTRPLSLKEFLIKSLTFLINLVKVFPISESVKNDIKKMLTTVDEKLTDPKEYSDTLKCLLNLNVDPKMAKKKRSATKKVDDPIIPLESATSFEIIDDKDRKQDIPIEKVGMSIKEKDLDHISYLDVKTINDNDFYNLFTYIQFNSYQKISATDLITIYRANNPQKATYAQIMIMLQDNTIQFIKGQLTPNQGGKGGKIEDPLISIKRWTRIAEIALKNNNIFFFQIIMKSLHSYVTKTEIPDKETSNKLKELMIYYTEENEARNKLSEIVES